MKTTSIREFRSNFTKFLAGDDSVLVLRHGKPAAVFFSLKDPEKIPAELRRKLFLAMTGEIAKQLQTKKITEKEIERDFAAHQKRRRR